MKTLVLIAKYLPVVMGTVFAVKQTVHAPGETSLPCLLDGGGR